MEFCACFTSPDLATGCEMDIHWRVHWRSTGQYCSWFSLDVKLFVLKKLLSPHVFASDFLWLQNPDMITWLQKVRRRRTAAWVREKILQLGPTFIKLGQLSSTRSDLFPAEFVEELSKLQVLIPLMLMCCWWAWWICWFGFYSMPLLHSKECITKSVCGAGGIEDTRLLCI